MNNIEQVIIDVENEMKRCKDERERKANKPRGRPFVKGNPGGPGRPKGSKGIGSYRRELLAAIDQGDMEIIMRRLVATAKHGSINAIRELLALSFGRNPKPLDDDGEEATDGN